MQDSADNFITKGDYEERNRLSADLHSRRGWLLFVGCDAGKDLATNTREAYHSLLSQRYGSMDKVAQIPFIKDFTSYFEDEGFDGTCPRLPIPVEGADAYVFQNCMDKREGRRSLNDNLIQLYQTICALNEFKAANITVVTPYYPYSRQDNPSFMQREVAFAHKVGKLLKEEGVDRILCYHPHATSIQYPFKYISGIDRFVDIFSEFKGDNNTVVLSTDAGGIKENKCIADALGLPLSTGAKDRTQQKRTECLGVSGDLEGKTRAILTDDESATFRSCLDMMKKVTANSDIGEFHVGISHMRLGPEFIDRVVEAHEKYGMVKLHTTDSIPQRPEITDLPFVEVHHLAKMWAFVVNSIHYDSSVSNLFYKPQK